jgi:hypothetical protein
VLTDRLLSVLVELSTAPSSTASSLLPPIQNKSIKGAVSRDFSVWFFTSVHLSGSLIHGLKSCSILLRIREEIRLLIADFRTCGANDIRTNFFVRSSP